MTNIDGKTQKPHIYTQNTKTHVKQVQNGREYTFSQIDKVVKIVPRLDEYIQSRCVLSVVVIKPTKSRLFHIQYNCRHCHMVFQGS